MYGRPSKTERANLGDPYRVYNELQNVGKTVEGSKKRIRWVFGFTESTEEFEVTLTHSMVSGKRTIKENGREIVSSSNMMATDFSYGWDSPNTHRLFRIEAQSNVTVENDYIFSIDGIRFSDLPPKPVGGGRKSTTETNARYGSEVNVAKRSSESHTTAQPQQRSSVNSRPNFQSPPAAKSRSSDDFDPFESNNHNKSGNFDPFNNAPPAAAHHGGGFDPFSNNTPPSNDTRSRPAQNNVQNKSVAKSIFDNVEEETPSSANTSSFDAFDNDPFSHQTTNTHANSDFGFDSFGEGNKKPTPVKSVAPPPAQPAQRKPANNATPDFFSQPVVNNPPAQASRRASAVEISMDFAGLSFESKPNGPAQPQLSQQPRDLPKPAEPEQPKEEETVDPWASNLIDLDLSGRAAAQRRSSLQATGGPSLNQMMGNTNQRRSSVNNDPFGAPDILPINNPPPQPIRPLNPSQAISSLGPPAAPYGVQPPLGYGAAPGYAPAPVPGYGAGRSSMTMPPGYAGGAPPAMQNTRGSFIGSAPGVNTQGYAAQPNKSSLDSLDWRS